MLTLYACRHAAQDSPGKHDVSIYSDADGKYPGKQNMKSAYLKQDRQERFNLKRGWFVDAWRIVDATGKDLVQPWSNTKAEARATAAALGYLLIEESKT